MRFDYVILVVERPTGPEPTNALLQLPALESCTRWHRFGNAHGVHAGLMRHLLDPLGLSVNHLQVVEQHLHLRESTTL